MIDVVLPHFCSVSIRKEGGLDPFRHWTVRASFGISPHGTGQLGADGNQTVLVELGVSYRQYGGRKIDIFHGQMQCLTGSQSGAVQGQEQRAECIAIKADGVLAVNIDRPKQALQFLTGVDVRWPGLWLSRLFVCCRQWRTRGITASDGVAVKSGEGAVLTCAPSGEWTGPVKESANLCLGNRIAAYLVRDPLAEVVQSACT